MQFLLPIFYSAVFIFLISKLRFFEIPSVSKTQLVLLFGLKLLAGASVILLYTYYYTTADFFGYFSDSKILFSNIIHGTHQPYSSAWTGNFENVLFSSSRLMIILNAFLQLFSFGNFYVHAVFFCFFSYAGLISLLKAFLHHFPNKNTRLVFALFFIPGVLFWGSAVLKESLVIALAGVFVYVSDFGLRKKYGLPQLILLVVLWALLFLIKMYVAVALIPVVLVNISVSRTSPKRLAVKYLVVCIALGLSAFAVSLFNSDYNALKLISDKQAKAISEAKGGVFLASDKHFVSVDYNEQQKIISLQTDSTYRIYPGSAYLMWDLENMKDTVFVNNSANADEVFRLAYSISPARSVLKIKKLQPQLLDFIAYSPVAFFNTLAHPGFFEIRSWLHLLVVLENMWVVVLIILAVFFFDKNILQKKEILFFCLVFAVLLFVLIGITTPAIGAMVRYKSIAELFLVIACLLCFDDEKLRRRFRR